MCAKKAWRRKNAHQELFFDKRCMCTPQSRWLTSISNFKREQGTVTIYLEIHFHRRASDILNWNWKLSSLVQSAFKTFLPFVEGNLWIQKPKKERMPKEVVKRRMESFEESVFHHCRATFTTSFHSWDDVITSPVWWLSSIFSKQRSSLFFIINDGIWASRNYDHIVRKMALHFMERAQKNISARRKIIIHVK